MENKQKSSNKAHSEPLQQCNVVGSASYRESFGLDNPPKGTALKLKYAEGVRYYLLWIGCPDNENIVQAWFPSKASALKYAKDNGWVVS